MKKFFSLLVAAVALVSCSSGNDDNALKRIQYFPFQSTEGGNWGMVSFEGEVLFADEFKECPTVVMDDRFFAKSGDGNYELYSAEKKPQQIGKQEYSQVGFFYNGIAPVVRPNQPIEFIDTDGNVKVVLKTVDGKSVETCSNFNEGVAVVNADGLFGVVDTSGKTVVKPGYDKIFNASDGKLIAMKKNGEKATVFVLSTGGDVISTFKSDKFVDFGNEYYRGVTWAKVEKGDTECCGLIDEKGEWVLNPMAKIKQVLLFGGNSFAYTDGECVGVMDFEGNIVLRAKYKTLLFADDSGKLFFVKNNESDSMWKLVDAEGNQVGNDEYDDVLPFQKEKTLVSMSKNETIFINKKGEDQKVNVDIVNLEFDTGNDVLVSEYVDVDAVVAQLKLEKNSIHGVKLDMKPKQVADLIKQVAPDAGIALASEGATLELPLTVAGDNKSLGIYFDETAYVEKEDGTLEYSDASIGDMQYYFNFSGRYASHLNDILEAVKKKVKTFGKVLDEKKGGVVVSVSDNAVYRVELNGEYLSVILGDKNIAGGPLFDE